MPTSPRQDRCFFRVCVDCDRKGRCVCRRLAGCGKGIDIDCLLRQCFRRERVSLIAAGQQRLILCPAFRVSNVPAFLRKLRLSTGRTKPAGERAGIERERMVITLRYGLGDRTPLTQREIAAKCGISRSYVSRIEKKALAALQQALQDYTQTV